MGSIKTPVVVTYCGKPFRCTSQTYSRIYFTNFWGACCELAALRDELWRS